MSALVWSDEISGLAVYAAGGVVEVTLPDGWSGRLTPSEAARLVLGFTRAMDEAIGLAQEQRFGRVTA